MKLNQICGTLLATALTMSAAAQVSLYIRTGPPALRHEERGSAPAPGYAWVDGYWAPDGSRYRWVSGRWDHPPYEGATWNHPHYDHYRQGWQLHEGHWDRENHGNDHGRERDRDHDRDH
jgi:WXXGXW repeat (2 copies)